MQEQDISSEQDRQKETEEIDAISMVDAEGPCRWLHVIRSRRNKLKISDYEQLPDSRTVLNQIEESTSAELIPMIELILQSEEVLAESARKTKSGQRFTLESEIVRQVLGNEIKQQTIDRIVRIFNDSIDAELIAPALVYHLELFKMTDLLPVAQAIRSNNWLRERWASLLSNQEFVTQLASSRQQREGESQYSDTIVSDINVVINATLLALTGPNSTADIKGLRASLQDFFNLDNKFYAGDPITINTFIQQLRKTTGEAYFEKQENKKEQEYASFLPTYDFSPVDLLSRKAESWTVANYLAQKYDDVQRILKKHFSVIYAEPTIKLLRIKDPETDREEGSDDDIRGEGNGWFSKIEGSIGIISPVLLRVAPDSIATQVIPYQTAEIKESKEDQTEETKESKHEPLLVPRGITDMVTLIHESAHDIFYTLVESQREQLMDDQLTYRQSAEHALNEGFAVLVELLFIDLVIGQPEEFGFQTEDIKKLQSCKYVRLSTLKRQPNGYTEGLYDIIHTIYSQAAGKPSERDPTKGLLAVRHFLNQVDATKLRLMSRDSEEYKNALQKRDPEEWLRLFTPPTPLVDTTAHSHD